MVKKISAGALVLLMALVLSVFLGGSHLLAAQHKETPVLDAQHKEIILAAQHKETPVLDAQHKEIILAAQHKEGPVLDAQHKEIIAA